MGRPDPTAGTTQRSAGRSGLQVGIKRATTFAVKQPRREYLAAAGIGTLGIVDDDTVDVSNLQRQVLFSADHAGKEKGSAAAERLAGLNADVNVRHFPVRCTAENVDEILAADHWDIVIDGADNFATRYLVNDACRLHGINLIHGSIYRFTGQVTTFSAASDQPCYRCLYPEPPAEGSVPSCGEIGVLGVLPGVIGSLMATEAIAMILGLGERLIGRILLYDALSVDFRTIGYSADPACRLCGTNPEITAIDPDEYLVGCSVDGNNEGIIMKAITVAELQKLRESGEEHTLIDVRESDEYAFGNIGGEHIPLGTLPLRIAEVPESGRVIMMCRSGGRSGRAVQILEEAGRTNVENLVGGILAWSAEIDPSVPAR